MKMLCLVCDKECKSGRSLSMHISNNHPGLGAVGYYKNYVNSSSGVCPCGESTPFLGLTRGFQKHCSSKCAANDVVVRERHNRTCNELYGVPHFTQTDEHRQKFKETSLERYGTEHPFQSDGPKKKYRKSCFEKYGTEYFVETDGFKELSKESMREHFGCEHAMQSPEVRTKSTQTMLERYGVENSMKFLPSFRKNRASAFKGKYIKIEEREFFCQGYEDYFLNEHDRFGYLIENLTDNVPTVKYSYNGKKRTYIPDFFYIKTNTVIEIKSGWTYDHNGNDEELRKNLEAKAKGCNNMGYDFVAYIFSSRKDIAPRVIEFKVGQ